MLYLLLRCRWSKRIGWDWNRNAFWC